MTDISANTSRRSNRRSATVIQRAVGYVAILAVTGMVSGCSSFLGGHSVTGIPVSRVSSSLLYGQRKDDFEDISLLRLRQDPPEFYALGPGHVLGIDIARITSIDPSVAALTEKADAGLAVALPRVFLI